jgi:hypothetical protein
MYITEKPISSSDMTLHKDYDRKGSVAKKKISGRGPRGAWRQDELIGFESVSQTLPYVNYIIFEILTGVTMRSVILTPYSPVEFYRRF